MEAAAKQSNPSLLAFAKQAIRKESDALLEVAEQLDDQFLLALNLIDRCRGAIHVTGMGKAGLIGQKISATLCSTGTRSFFLHPAEAIHGDLGRVNSTDVVIVLSMSGETEELVRLLPSLRKLSGALIAITSHESNTLAQKSDAVLTIGRLEEVDENGLAPSTSTTAMLAVGDALALSVSRKRGFDSLDFAKFHPGGSLGRKLASVSEFMRPLDECRIARESQSVRETFVTLRRPGRRTGAVMIVDDEQRLVGVFTDSDLARLLEGEADGALNQPVREVMTKSPLTVSCDARMPVAISLLAEKQISELPIVDEKHCPVGLIDITDLIDWLPRDTKQEPLRVIRFPGTDGGSDIDGFLGDDR